MQNQLNQISVVRLQPDRSRGEVSGTIASAEFDVPTKVAESGAQLYAVDARFGTAPGPHVEYHIVRVDNAPDAR